ncbi:serine hydrolase [Paenibacillus segetis]|uniref:Beta-lactamase-related domain-containing protein n=1 Tax=Paenibacillus segetis TaxID=1325360 RepID=A0ABQ1YDC2_9BACL|nr:serine hydrolase [Paenibacillus segetis]GGH21894.1 hypothetical protein GCM10008013_20060 [Paenibacillus segetis]
MSDIQRIIDNLDQILPQFLQDELSPGLAVGVVYDHQMIYAKGFGVKNVQTGEAIDEHTLFHMASVSKTFVVTGIMQLVEEGKINLDTAVSNYLPYFALTDDRYQQITVRLLLNHTSGMPDEDDFGWDRPEYDEGSLERYVRSISGLKLLKEPKESFYYSNIGYEILGDVIAKVSGVSFEQFMKERILIPSSMLMSSFLKQEIPDHKLASPHILGIKDGFGPELSEIFPYHRAHGPSSTLYTNVVELCNYALTHLNLGQTAEGVRILTTNSYEEMWSKYALTHYGDWSEDIGLGWFLGEYKGLNVCSHSGMDTGFRSNLLLLPENGIAIAIMTNADFIGNKVLCKAILDIILGEDIPYVKKSLATYLSKITIESGVEAAISEYTQIQESSMEEYLVLEGSFNAYAYMMLERGWLQEGIAILQLSIHMFPGSSNLHDSIGEMYLLAGERNLALQHYQKSVELDPTHMDGINKINELLGVM